MPDAPHQPNDQARNQRVITGLKSGQQKSSPAKLLAHPGEDREHDDHWNDAGQWFEPAPINGWPTEQVEQIQGCHGWDDREEQREGPPLDADSPDQDAAKQFPNAALSTFNHREDDPRQARA